MELASAFGSAHLDPAAKLVTLPDFLTTPVSFYAWSNFSNTQLFEYLAFAQRGNYDLCSSIQGARYCTMRLTNAGPAFGLCLPSSCSVDDYINLTTVCVARRAIAHRDSAAKCAEPDTHSRCILACVVLVPLALDGYAPPQ